jgi:acyl CoA:acetate/3-ketoacid CoA transferase beta subunit
MSTPYALNPNHKTAQQAEFQWHKICALALLEQGVDDLLIKDTTILEAQGKGLFLTIQDNAEGIRLRLVDEATAQQLSREHGGLPS